MNASLSTSRLLEEVTRPFGGPSAVVGGHYIVAGAQVLGETRAGTVLRDGRVLEVDLCASLPIRIEYTTPGGDKRIERFAPNEFKMFRRL